MVRFLRPNCPLQESHLPPDVGWCKGKIISVNTDGRFKVGGANVNFIIYYEVDDDNSKHALSLAAFGEDKDWVLLEKA